MLAATSFQITLLSGQNWQDDTQLYVLGAVFLASSIVWYILFRLKPSVYVLSAPWIFFGIAFLLVGLPSVTRSMVGAHRAVTGVATWSYAVASAAAFLFFGLNFGEEAVRHKSFQLMEICSVISFFLFSFFQGAATEVWTLRACVVQGSQQIWVAALWYWGYSLNGQQTNYIPPWWIVLIIWPLSVMSFLFAYLMLYGLPGYFRYTRLPFAILMSFLEYYRQTPPQVPNFLKTLFRRKLVLW